MLTVVYVDSLLNIRCNSDLRSVHSIRGHSLCCLCDSGMFFATRCLFCSSIDTFALMGPVQAPRL